MVLVRVTLSVVADGHVEAVAYRRNSGKGDAVQQSAFGTGQFHAPDLGGAVLALTLDEQRRVVRSEIDRTIALLELRNWLRGCENCDSRSTFSEGEVVVRQACEEEILILAF